MQKRILLLLYKWIEKINKNTNAALNKIRQHLYFMDYDDRESDIYIVTFMKSGTTWLQVILYNLLTDGNMDFEHIYNVSPWPRNEAYKNKSAEAINSLPSPRILKSHDEYDFFNADTKCKFIHVYRDGKDVAASLYHHNKNYRDAELTFQENFEQYFSNEDGAINWFVYNREWFENKNGFNILYISYEQLKNDFDKVIHKIAEFLNAELTDEIIERIKRHASFEYMKENETKFGEVPPSYTKLVFNQFIRKGTSGEGNSYLNKEQNEFFDEKFKITILPFLNKLG